MKSFSFSFSTPPSFLFSLYPALFVRWSFGLFIGLPVRHSILSIGNPVGALVDSLVRPSVGQSDHRSIRPLAGRSPSKVIPLARLLFCRSEFVFYVY